MGEKTGGIAANNKRVTATEDAENKVERQEPSQNSSIKVEGGAVAGGKGCGCSEDAVSYQEEMDQENTGNLPDDKENGSIHYEFKMEKDRDGREL